MSLPRFNLSSIFLCVAVSADIILCLVTFALTKKVKAATEECSELNGALLDSQYSFSSTLELQSKLNSEKLEQWLEKTEKNSLEKNSVCLVVPQTFCSACLEKTISALTECLKAQMPVSVFVKEENFREVSAMTNRMQGLSVKIYSGLPAEEFPNLDGFLIISLANGHVWNYFVANIKYPDATDSFISNTMHSFNLKQDSR